MAELAIAAAPASPDSLAQARLRLIEPDHPAEVAALEATGWKYDHEGDAASLMHDVPRRGTRG